MFFTKPLRPRRRIPSARFCPGIEWLESRDLLSGNSSPSLLLQLKPGAEAALPELTRVAAVENATLRTTYIPGLFEITGSEANLSRLQANLSRNALVEYVEPIHELFPLRDANDPIYTSGGQWYLNGMHGIDIPPAWDVTTGSTRVIVAVPDSGIAYDHPDLYLNIWINQAEIPAARRVNLTDIDGDSLITFWDLNNAINQGVGKITDVNMDGRISGSDVLATLNPDGTGGWANQVDEEVNLLVDDLIGWDFRNNDNNPADGNGHGTVIAGIIGAIGNNGLGTAGVNWRVQLMPLKTSSDATGSSTDLDQAEAMRYAADKGVRVANHSYGGYTFSETLASAHQYTTARDMLWTVGAGNDQRDTDAMPFYPAGINSPNIITVAATTTGILSFFSNYGFLSVDLGAPGESLVSTIPPDSTAPVSGTSFAAPQVAGVAALLLAQNPTWTTAHIVNRILTTVTPSTGLVNVTGTGGTLNAQAALQGSTTVELSWAGGGVTGPPGALPGTTFTVNRTYTISGSAAPASFTIAYYRSADTVFGNPDDVLLATETISSTAARAVGTHSGTSPNLQTNTPGTYYLFARLDEGGVLTERNEGNNVTRAPQVVVVGTLRVTSFKYTSSGLRIGFNLPIDPSVLNLIDTPTAGLGPADVAFTDSSGNPVSGTLLVDATATQISFHWSGGVILPSPTPATLRLRSSMNGFRTPGGALLDGNSDGVPGDDLFVPIAAPPPAFDTILSIPDVVRGPGQTVRVPAASPGLPIRLSNGAGVTRVSFDLLYDPALFTPTGVTRGPSTPSTATATLTIYFPGVAVIRFTSPTALGAGPIDFVTLLGTVPNTAPYGSKALLDIYSSRINDNGLVALDDDGVQIVAYLGDTTGNARYSTTDAMRALRVAVGLDSGFDAYRLADPALIADVNGNSRITSVDAAILLREALGIHQAQIPPLPEQLPEIIQGGPDPLLRFPSPQPLSPRKGERGRGEALQPLSPGGGERGRGEGFRGRPGETVRVPLLLDPSDGLEAADLIISYDPTRLEVVSESDVQRGDLTEDFDLLGVNLDPHAGTIRVGLGRTAGPISGRGSGSVLVIAFRIRNDAPSGSTIINLRHGLGHATTQLNEGGLDLIPDPSDEEGDALDGAILIQKQTARRLARDQVFALMSEGGRGLRAELVNEFFRTAVLGEALSRRRRSG